MLKLLYPVYIFSKQLTIARNEHQMVYSNQDFSQPAYVTCELARFFKRGDRHENLLLRWLPTCIRLRQAFDIRQHPKHAQPRQPA